MPQIQQKKTAPSELPPELKALVDAAAVQDGPTLPIDQVAASAVAEAADAPSVLPPAETVAEAAAEAITAGWQNGVKITALWVNASPRNAWAGMPGLGWKRIVANNDATFLTVTQLLSHARQTNATCNVRLDSDDMIHEVYVW